MIRIKKSEAGYWYVVTANNNRVLVTSETFTRKSNCLKSIYSLREMIRDKEARIVDETR